MTELFSYSRTESRPVADGDIVRPKTEAELIALVKGWHGEGASGPHVVIRSFVDTAALQDQSLAPSAAQLGPSPENRTIYLLLDKLPGARPAKRADLSKANPHVTVVDPLANEPWERALIAPGWAWAGSLLKAAFERADDPYIPYTLPTSAEISVGGMVGTNALSRFSMLFGKFEDCVTWIRLLLADGSVVRVYHPHAYTAVSLGADEPLGDAKILPKAENDELFHAVFGADGMLGVVLRARIGLLSLKAVKNRSPLRKPSLKMVTRCVAYRQRGAGRYSWLRPMLAEYSALVQAQWALQPTGPDRRPKMRAWGAKDWSTIGMIGMILDDAKLSGGLYHMGFGRKVVPSTDGQFTPWDLTASKWYQSLAILLGLLPSASASTEKIMFGETYKAAKTGLQWDKVPGATFMMDAHTVSSRAGQHATGNPREGMAVQISYSFPLVSPAAGVPYDIEAIVGFCAAAQDLFMDPNATVVPNICDILVLPPCAALLSPIPDTPSLVVTFSIEGLRNYREPVAPRTWRKITLRGVERQLGDYAAALTRLSSLAWDFGGRMHFGKSMFIDARVLRGMYGDRLDTFIALKKKVDPHSRWFTGQFWRIRDAASKEPAPPNERPPYTLGAPGGSERFGITSDQIHTEAMWQRQDDPVDPVAEAAPPGRAKTLHFFMEDVQEKLTPGQVQAPGISIKTWFKRLVQKGVEDGLIGNHAVDLTDEFDDLDDTDDFDDLDDAVDV